MLHEILLSLSGLPSPLWDQVRATGHNENGDARDYVSPPEQAMLKQLSYLSDLHIELQQQTAVISTGQSSPVCQVIGSSIANKHLGLFRKKIAEVESSLISESPSHVGGYNIVPLSTIVTDFAPWIRRLEWLLKTTRRLLGNDVGTRKGAYSSAKALDYLESERHTGYSDIEELATELLIAAQSVWMRSVSLWLLYGQVATLNGDDFMIRRSTTTISDARFDVRLDLVPGFVTSSCAKVILAVGTALNQLKHRGTTVTGGFASADAVMQLVSSSLSQLASLKYPLNPSMLEAVIAKINQTISENALSQILPVHKIVEFVEVIQSYLLIGRGEFAITLINNLDERLISRTKPQTSSQPVRKLGRTAGHLSLSCGELAMILSKTWSDLSALQSDFETEDSIFVLAKKHLHLVQVNDEDNETFISTVSPSPAMLDLKLPAESSLNLFVSSLDIMVYSRINAYLLSIRRAELRLSGLWKLTSLRRCHPAPLAPPTSGTPYGQRVSKQRRNREDERALQVRRFWSTMSNVLFVINEIGAYLQGEVIHNSWQHFYAWLVSSKTDETRPTMATSETASERLNSQFSSGPSTKKPNLNTNLTSNDPRAIADAHRRYLDCMHSALLLKDKPYCLALKSLLNLIDHFVALFASLQTVWQGLDLQEDDGVMDAFSNYAQDEKDVLAEMQRSHDEITALLERLVGSIKDIEKQGDVVNVTEGIATINVKGLNGDFQPWRARTLDRLIMKLDFLHGTNGNDSGDEEDIFEDAL